MSAGSAPDVEPASLCSVFIRTIAATPEGERPLGTATGFLYRDARGGNWLVTSGQVLSGRRPEESDPPPADAPQVPSRIEVVYPGPRPGMLLPPVAVELQEKGEPVWRRHRGDRGIDLAALPVVPPPGSVALCVQDFAGPEAGTLSPGTEVTVVGFPGEPGSDLPLPVWKRATIAAASVHDGSGAGRTLLDMAEIPGMRGSPVYAVGPAGPVEAFDSSVAMERIEWGLLGTIESMRAATRRGAVRTMSLVGVLAGATGDPRLDRLSLAVLVPAADVGRLVTQGDGTA